MRALLAFAGRSFIASLALSCLILIVVAYCRVIGHNAALLHELNATDRDIVAFSALRHRQREEIRRLSDPHGAIPEIHDRLRLVGKNEALIYLEGTPAPALTSLP